MTEAPGAYAVRDVVDKRQLSSQQCSAAFTNDKREGHAPRMLVRDEPLASINTEALEGYVSGHFELQAEVKRFLASHPQYPRDRRDDLRAQRVTNLLKRPVYAGYVEARADWSSPKNKR